jgi:hypothetical protein
MARPQKNNADYFPHDANMRDDAKVKALKARYALEGYAVWCILLEMLTDADNFTLQWDELNIELAAGDIGIEAARLTEIIEYMQRIRLIEIDTEKHLIYTTRHRERMEPIIVARERKRQWKQENATKATTKTPTNSESDDESTQSKVKETKVKETKERENGAHPPNGTEYEKKSATVNTIADAIDQYVTSDGLQELITWKRRAGYSDRVHGPTTAELQKFISRYIDDIRRAADPMQYYRDHFPAWLARAVEYNKPKNNQQQPPPAKYEPPPNLRRPNATEAITIGDIAGKIITEI